VGFRAWRGTRGSGGRCWGGGGGLELVKTWHPEGVKGGPSVLEARLKV
jgi:hypothetical protein